MQLPGLIVPLVTPFTSDDLIDAPVIRRLVEYVAREGAEGLMPTAVTGEGLLLSDTETLAVWDAVFAAASGLPVVPAIIRTTTRGAVELVRQVCGAPCSSAPPVTPAAAPSAPAVKDILKPF
jgi:dihydrodipicolinate synthase/N-acetylneuraminate lyase